MRSQYLFNLTKDCQNGLYENLNKFSVNHKGLGRLSALPVSFIDVAIDVLKMPLFAIENVAFAALYLVGSAFSHEYSLKGVMYEAEIALANIAFIPVKLVVAPFKFTFQFFAILIDPVLVQSSHYTNNTFKLRLN